jgi:hypothetical protein
MSSLPDMPDAHLWRYNCVAPGAVQNAAFGMLGNDKPSVRKAVASNDVHRPTRSAIIAVPDEPVPDAPVPVTSAAAAAPASASTPAVREEPTPIDEPATVPTPPPVPVIASTPVPTAATPVPLTGGASAAAVTPAVAPSAAASLPPDLTAVDAKDPAAATRINSYCSKVTASAANKDTVALGCRREEIAAWNRFAVQNEFPSLDDATRQKCNNPPFPDSYVAKEACAKYQLRVN